MNKKLDGVNMFSIVTQATIGIQMVTIPQVAVRYAKNDAWLCPIIVGIITLITARMGFWVLKQFPGLNWAQLNEKALGKILGKGALMLIVGYSILINGISLRFFAESINTFLLENTPRWVIMSLFLVLVFYCLKRDMRSIAIIFDILLPFVLFFMAMLLILSLTTADFKNMLPVLCHGPMPVLKGSLNTLNPAAAAYVFAFILPYFNNPKETMKYITRGIIFSAILYSLVISLCIAALGDVEILYLTFPTLTLSKSIQVDIQLLERAESFFMTAWIPITFTTMVTYCLTSTIALKEFFKTQKNSLIIIVEILLIFIIAFLPGSVGEVFIFLNYSNLMIILINFLYIPLVALIVLIKKRCGKIENKEV